MTPTVYLLHGRDSSPLSIKIVQLSAIATLRGWKVVAPDFSATKDPDLRVSLFLKMAEGNPEKNVIVGSSMGGVCRSFGIKNTQARGFTFACPGAESRGVWRNRSEACGRRDDDYPRLER